MGSQERREREKNELRGKILSAARELFAERGVEAVTMRAIAQRIEYTATAIYFHFKDKADLLSALLTEDFILLAAQFHEIAEISDPIERLRRAATAYVRFGHTHPNQYRLMFMTPIVETAVEGPVPIEKGSCANDAYAFLQQMVSDAADAGVLRDELVDRELVCQLFHSTLHGIVSMRIAHGPGTVQAKSKHIEWRATEDLLELACNAMFAGTIKEKALREWQRKHRAPSTRTTQAIKGKRKAT
ncbi:MAG: TetR/AcrR family transcriptional regulator [Polyangiaceae bacterium]